MATLEVGGAALSAQDRTDIKTGLDLQNVNNTSDANKPVSTAQATALAAKADAAAVTSALAGKANTADLGTAAFEDSGAFATAAQGAKADTAAQIAGDLGGTAATPVVTRVNGVTITGTPTAGQVPVASSGTAAAWGAVPGAGIPSAFTSRALTDDDNGDTLICASAQTATVNTGRVAGFGCGFKGTISFNGTATVTDVRTTGAANPWCALVQTGIDTYDAVGSKA